MATFGGATKALALVMIMLCSSQLSMYAVQSGGEELAENKTQMNTSGDVTTVNIAGPGSIGVGPTIAMSSN
ncbi:MAG: hypothetical protein VW862_08395, partial [Euryarchaeota archaeon]